MVFYSRADENYFSGSRRYISTGNTEKVINMVAETTGADLFKIEQKIPYAANYGTCIVQAKKICRQKQDRNWFLCQTAWRIMMKFIWAIQTIGVIYRWRYILFWRILIGTEGRIRNACKGATVTGGLAVQGSMVDHARPNVERWV